VKEEIDITGRIENWTRVQVTAKEFVIYGNLYEDSKERFEDGTPIKTSGIKNTALKEGDVVTTRNSKYLLGQELDLSEQL